MTTILFVEDWLEHLVPGVPGTWEPVPGNWEPVPGTWVSNLYSHENLLFSKLRGLGWRLEFISFVVDGLGHLGGVAQCNAI